MPQIQKTVDISEVFAQSKSNATQIQEQSERLDSFGRSLDHLRETVTMGFSEIKDRVNLSGQPNFQTLASWAGILLGIIGLISAPIAYHFNHTIESLDSKLQKEYTLINETMAEKVGSQKRSLDELDSRLQREFLTSQDFIKQTAITLNQTLEKRHEEVVGRINRLETWTLDSIRGDLEELRKRRMEK